MKFQLIADIPDDAENEHDPDIEHVIADGIGPQDGHEDTHFSLLLN